MKTIVSLAVALAAIPVGATLAATTAAEPPPPPEADLAARVLPDAPSGLAAGPLQSRVVRLSARARAHAKRLGLAAGAPVRPSTSLVALASQELRLTRVVTFLGDRREVRLAVDERAATRLRHDASLGSGELARLYAAVSRLAHRLGIDRPAAPTPASTPQGRVEQLARWRAIARWLSNRSERLRPDERPVSERIPHYEALMCIAGHESSRTWGISTGNGYYGGLQMDRGFQQSYAPGLYRSKGTADNWTAEEQMQAAGRAIATRGFTPWPNTARMCGLL